MAKEYIERKALMDFANNHVNGIIDTNDIARFPAADVVEVVRCKDCFYNANGTCTKSEYYDDTRYRPDYFCADAERRDDDDI